MVLALARTLKDMIDPKRVKELTAREEQRLNDSTTSSGQLYERAKKSMVNGVPSSYQTRDPWPIYISHGRPRLQKSGTSTATRCIDFHNGFGSMVQGHAHPAIIEAVQERVELGTHFAAPIEDAIVVSEELARRFGLPDSGATSTPARKRRWTRSGSPARFTGRDTIVKIFGSYHGHHDYVMVSIGVPYDEIGDRENYASLPYGAGIPQVGRRHDDRRAVQRREVHWSDGSSA